MRRWTLTCLALLACGVIAAASLLACGKPVTPATANVRPTYDPTTGRLTKLSADANGNGVPDTWGYMDGPVVVRVEVDEDEDGRIDRWEYHHPPVSPDRARPDQTLERIERSTRRDGRVSRWEYFANGVMTRAEFAMGLQRLRAYLLRFIKVNRPQFQRSSRCCKLWAGWIGFGREIAMNGRSGISAHGGSSRRRARTQAHARPV